MKRTTALGVFVVALAFVFTTASVPGAFAQDPKGGGGGGGGGQGGGGASPRGGGGEGGGSRAGGAAAAAPAPSSSGGSSGGAVWSGGGMSGGDSGMSAVPRGAGRVNDGSARQPSGNGPRWAGAGAATSREGRPADGTASRRSATDDQMAGRSRGGTATSGVESSVPWYSRPRGANPATGTAVARPDVPLTGGGGGGYYPGYPLYPGYPGYGGGYWGGYYDCYYYPYGCGNPWGYGAFGLGYFYFNPFGWNYGDYAGWGGYGGGGGTYGGQQMGSIRLKVKPSNASVYVDGYYAGTVDDFDNAFQKLSISLGRHRLEFSAPGYQPLIVEIDVRDFDTISYQGQLEPIR